MCVGSNFLAGFGFILPAPSGSFNPSPTDEQEEYFNIKKILSENERILFRDKFMSLDASLKFNIFANIAKYEDFDYSGANKEVPIRDRKSELLVPYRDLDPFAYGELRLFWGDLFQLEGSVMLGNNYHHLYESSFGWFATKYNNDISTIFNGKDGNPSVIAADFPYRAGISIGNDFLSIIAGRYRHQVGNGKTGNLLIGDNFIFQDILKVSFFSRYISYQMSITRFDPMEKIENSTYYQLSRNKFRGDHQFRILHQLSASLLDRVRLTFNLMTLYNSTSSLDIRFLYPFMAQHNYSNYDNQPTLKDYDEANNQMGINLDILLAKGLSCSFQFLLDQAQTPYEEQGSVPGAYAALGNIAFSHAFNKFIYDGWIECVYTNPYVYLNGKYKDNNDYEHNLDYIVGNHMWFTNDISYSGYEHGPDAIVIATGHTLKDKNDRLKIGTSLLYRMKGEKGYKVRYKAYHESEIDMDNAYFGPDEGKNPKKTPSGIVEHMIQMKLGASYTFPNNISLYTGFYSALYYNYERITDKDNIWKNLLTIGFKWHI